MMGSRPVPQSPYVSFAQIEVDCRNYTYLREVPQREPKTHWQEAAQKLNMQCIVSKAHTDTGKAYSQEPELLPGRRGAPGREGMLPVAGAGWRRAAGDDDVENRVEWTRKTVGRRTSTRLRSRGLSEPCSIPLYLSPPPAGSLMTRQPLEIHVLPAYSAYPRVCSPGGTALGHQRVLQ